MKEFELIIHYDRIGESDMFNSHGVGELVRCKDCKHYMDLGFMACEYLRVTCDDNDFCSRGERKDEVEE